VSDDRPVDVSGGVNVTLEHILIELFQEAVRSRIRHRALLTLLAERGTISLREYVAEYQKQEESDFPILSDILMLPREDFINRYPEWVRRDQERFGYSPVARLGISLTPAEVSSQEHPSVVRRSGKSRAGKATTGRKTTTSRKKK
jgi:hypothetical protein